MQDFPHVPAPILMQGLMTCPEHILVQYRAEFPEDFPLVIRQLTCCRITVAHMIYPVPELVQDFPHVPTPILMQGLMTCPEHILVQYRPEFPEDFPLVIRQLTCCRKTVVHMIYPVPERVQDS